MSEAEEPIDVSEQVEAYEPASEAYEEPVEARAEARGTSRGRLAPIPPALLALPRPVLAAALNKKNRDATSGVREVGGGKQPTVSGSERQARQARRAWVEQHKLLHQRAALLGREIFPPSSLTEHALAELLAPVFAEAVELTRTRSDEAAALAAARNRAAKMTSRLGELVAHIGAGGSYMDELRSALEGADAELSALKSS